MPKFFFILKNHLPKLIQKHHLTTQVFNTPSSEFEYKGNLIILFNWDGSLLCF